MNRVVKMKDWVLWFFFGVIIISFVVVIVDLIVLIRLHQKYSKLIQAYKEGILETNNLDLINEYLGD